MTNKKTILVWVTLLLFSLFLIGCQSEKESEVEEVTTEKVTTEKVITEKVTTEEVTTEEATTEEATTEEVTTEEVTTAEVTVVDALVDAKLETIGIGSTITFAEMEITFNSVELYEKDAYNSYVAVSVHLNNVADIQNFIGGSMMTVTNEVGEIIRLELFDVGDYKNIVKASPMKGEMADAFILMATKEVGSYTIVFDDPYEDDEPIIVTITL